jgi:FkbM family methyltransferase
MLNVAKIHAKHGFRFAEVSGTPADHASWWTFDDEQEVRDRWWHPKEGEIVLDVGAAFGSYALPALAAGARVVCFSPADFDTELLCKNLELNPELARRCLVVRDGLHEGDGWFDPDRSLFSPKGEVLLITAEQFEHLLRVRSLDSWLAERPGIDRVDWVKMDVEGAELGVLKGAEDMLRRWRPRLLIELHEQHVPDMAARVWSFLDDLRLGYRCAGPIKHCAVSHAFYEAQR